MNLQEFAAQRRTAQDELIDLLLPIITEALTHLNDDLEDGAHWFDPIVVAARKAYAREFRAQGGERITLRVTLIRRLLASLNKIENPTSSTAQSTAVALAVATLNFATLDAAKANDEPVVMEWVTMHDDDVRDTHRAADGQQRPIGEKFSIDGVPMIAPGDMTAPIELWINCRCVLAPTLPNLAASGVTVDQPTEEFEVSDPEATDLTMPLTWHGVLAPEGEWSGDGRMFAENSLTFRDLPLPLTWQKTSADGHDGSVVVGSIDAIERKDGMMTASGAFLPTPEADELVGLIAHFGKFGVSVDADDVVFSHEETDDGQMRTTFTAARVCSASVLPIPAFAQAFIALGSEAPAAVAASVELGRGPGWITNPEDTKRLHDYWTVPGQPGYEKVQWGVPGDFERCRIEIGEEIGENSPDTLRFLNQICAQWHHDATGFWPGHAPTEQALTPEGDAGPALTLVASNTPIAPAAWFANPGLTKPTPLHVGQDGRVFGHIAEWGICHVGFTDVCVEAPTSPSNYAYFHNGTVLTEDGPIPVGHLTVGGGHAGPLLSTTEALAHYDSTSTVVADVCAGEDDYGIWCAGWVRPGATPEQVYALRAAPLSGDWRTIGGNLELVLGHAVNSGGFPITRVAAGLQTSLVAAGVVQRPAERDPAERIADNLAEQVAAHLEARQSRREKMLALANRVRGDH